MFFFDFLYWYFIFSVLCLIKDIFFSEQNIIKYDLQKTVELYSSSSIRNFQNLWNLVPFFVTLEMMYSYSDDYSMFRSYLQVFFEIYFACFLSLLIRYFRGETNKYNNNLICVFNILQHNGSDLYFDYLLPWCFLPFTIGLNKLAIDIIFYLCIFYIFMVNSNMSFFVNVIEQLNSYLKIKEFNNELNNLFCKVNNKYSKYMTREGTEILVKEE